MNNQSHYLKNTLWQKVNGNIQACQAILNEAEQEVKELRTQLFFWLDYWKRELRIIELEDDAFRTKDSEKRRAILQQMKELIQINKELKKQLKNYEK